MQNLKSNQIFLKLCVLNIRKICYFKVKLTNNNEYKSNIDLYILFQILI